MGIVQFQFLFCEDGFLRYLSHRGSEPLSKAILVKRRRLPPAAGGQRRPETTAMVASLVMALWGHGQANPPVFHKMTSQQGPVGFSGEVQQI